MPEFSSMLLALLIGGYTIVGGLGGTFFVAYTNVILLFSLILFFQFTVYYNMGNDPSNPFGNNTREGLCEIYLFVSGKNNVF